MSGFVSDVRVFLRDLRALCSEFFSALTEEEFSISALSDGGVVLSAKPRGSRRADVVVIPAGEVTRVSNQMASMSERAKRGDVVNRFVSRF